MAGAKGSARGTVVVLPFVPELSGGRAGAGDQGDAAARTGFVRRERPYRSRLAASSAREAEASRAAASAVSFGGGRGLG